ncbi:putative flippase GtrA [Ancylobacter sp. 3268]|uniref:GtrA family protein n=1 Tax=Ancylobacter sp. 3268 TaxID=2817752 RepID=UPI0028662E46|nr:GtrA family protein [Ancylobacter sp. 3268]MDR6951676.1 putative flippase GtrA [Ancylobacter sp. 3268]
MTPARRIAALYALFAVLAISMNLAAQWCVLRIAALANVEGWPGVFLALAFGTGVGLVAKYCLDKRYIFRDSSTGAAAHAQKFLLYGATGLVTTAIFWAAEIIGSLIDPEGASLYIGGALGLMVGYAMKYRLDKAVVFDAPSLDASRPEERPA